jgi:hypothetical protein
MLDFEKLNELIGTPEMFARSAQYDVAAAPVGKKSGPRR